MVKTLKRAVLALVALALGLVWMTVGTTGQAGYTPSLKNGDWTHYTGDVRGARYSPLDQINASNFNKLEVAWRFKTDNLGSRPEYKLEGTPLAIKGVLYVTGGTRRAVVALDGKSGELIWTHSYREGNRAVVAPRQLSGRGVSYWTDGKGDERVLYITTGYRLIALNAKNGAMIPSFGTGGVVDLKKGVVFGKEQQIDLETGEIGVHSTPTVTKDVIIVGSAMKEGMTIETHNNTKGLVRAFDVKTGKLLWTFNLIPRPGEFGNDTWENESWAVNGNTGVWPSITVDEEAGLVYLPVEDPSSDFYGGHRPGNNLYGDSIVCVDLKTGQRKWHFQVTHHPIWDYDLSSPPIMFDINVNGKAIKAVALPSKQGFLYTFDRITGQPVWPIEERPVPQSDVPDEKTAATQPFPTKPPAYSRQAIGIDDLIDFTPALRAEAVAKVKKYRLGPMYLPPTVSKLEELAALTTATTGGGINWPGGGGDPTTHTFYAEVANASVVPIGLVPPPSGFSDLRYIAGEAGEPFTMRYAAGNREYADAPPKPATAPPAPAPAAAGAAPARRAEGIQTVQGLPLLKPPYNKLIAIDLDKGEMKFDVPFGETPDAVRNSPLLKGMTIPKTGMGGGNVGIVVTKTLVIAGEGVVTTTPDRPRGAMLRAHDKDTGKEVGAVWMPAPQSGSPMTYSVGGKQYIVVAVSGGNYSGEYIAFSLPASEIRTTSQGGGQR